MLGSFHTFVIAMWIDSLRLQEPHGYMVLVGIVVEEGRVRGLLSTSEQFASPDVAKRAMAVEMSA